MRGLRPSVARAAFVARAIFVTGKVVGRTARHQLHPHLQTQVLQTQVLQTQVLQTQVLQTQVLQTQMLQTQVPQTQVR
jgi:hypothetical protein